jgi:hypothetical protein
MNVDLNVLPCVDKISAINQRGFYVPIYIAR